MPSSAHDLPALAIPAILWRGIFVRALIAVETPCRAAEERAFKGKARAPDC